jgi:hypothetical protein
MVPSFKVGGWIADSLMKSAGSKSFHPGYWTAIVAVLLVTLPSADFTNRLTLLPLEHSPES